MATPMATPVALRLRESPWPTLPMDAALAAVRAQAAAAHQPVVRVASGRALGLVLAQDVVADAPFPPFRASIMDGYAVVAADGPGTYRVVGPASTAGGAPAAPVAHGSIARITTGAPVPDGADAVVMVEQTALVQRDAGDPNEEALVEVRQAVRPGENVRQVGSDIAQGERVLAAGDLLGAAEVALLAAVGVREVDVVARPTVAVVSTGNELVDADDTVAAPGLAQIRDSNRPALLAVLQQHGFATADLGIANDTVEHLVQTIRRGLDAADVLVTSGGVSMGETDLLKPALLQLGCAVHFGRVHMKPGKPTTFATLEHAGRTKLAFALPGNPVSAIVTFYVFVLPALRAMSGFVPADLPVVPVEVTSDIALDARPEYQRATLRPRIALGSLPAGVGPLPAAPFWLADVTGGQISSRLLSLRSANALLVLPARTGERTVVPRGSMVSAILIGTLQ